MKFKPKLKPLAAQSVGIEGFLTIKDANTQQVLISKKNAINYENMSIAIANVLASRSNGSILRMAFGNGASSVDVTGVISYLPPNATGQNAALYKQTYSKIIDDTMFASANFASEAVNPFVLMVNKLAALFKSNVF